MDPPTRSSEDPLAAHSPPPPPPPPARTARAGGGGRIGPADVIGRWSWAEILEPHGWTLVGHGTVAGGVVELWRRPGATTPYSLKAWPDGPAVNWSAQSGLPVGEGQRLSKWRVFCWLAFAGDESAAAREIRSRAKAVRR